MAFVFRSDKILRYSDNEDNNNPGPGEYILDSRQNLKANKVPFGMSSPRSEKIKNGVPGPGSYYSDRRNIDFFQNQQQYEPLYKRLDKNMNKEYILSRILKSETPGPGYYFKDKHKNELKKNENSKIIKHPVYTSQRVCSIPLDPFGYELDDNGNLLKNKNPEISMRYKGIKNDKVGPDRYEVLKSSDWIKNVTDWSKNKKEKIETIKKEDPEMILTSETDYTYQEKKNFIRESMIRNFKESRKKIEEIKENSLKPDLIDFFSSEQPGPGYYHNEMAFSCFKPKKNDKNFQFGSHEKRGLGFIYVEKEKYRDDSKYLRKKYENIKQKLNLNQVFIKDMGRKRQTSAENKVVKEINTLGPGAYDLPQLKPKPPNPFNCFGSLEKRFIDKKPPSPGPASYFKYVEKPRIKFVREYVAKPQVMPILIKLSQEHDNIPPVGAYEPKDSIEYKMMQNVYKFNNKNAPFSVQEERFKPNKPSIHDNLGPGCYYKEKRLKRQKKVLIPPIKKFNADSSIHSNDVGPGQYNLENPYDWNKKSYNILYV